MIPRVGDECLDAIASFGFEEVGTDVNYFSLASRVAKMAHVPIDALVKEGGEKLGLLDAVRQIDVALEHAIGARSSRCVRDRRP